MKNNITIPNNIIQPIFMLNLMTESSVRDSDKERLQMFVSGFSFMQSRQNIWVLE
jgi:hypothetical protein